MCNLATEEKMRYKKFLNVSEMTVVVGGLWCIIFHESDLGTRLMSQKCGVSPLL